MIAGVISFDDVGNFINDLCIGNIISWFIYNICITRVSCISWTNIRIARVDICITRVDIGDIDEIYLRLIKKHPFYNDVNQIIRKHFDTIGCWFNTF